MDFLTYLWYIPKPGRGNILDLAPMFGGEYLLGVKSLDRYLRMGHDNRVYVMLGHSGHGTRVNFDPVMQAQYEFSPKLELSILVEYSKSTKLVIILG